MHKEGVGTGFRGKIRENVCIDDSNATIFIHHFKLFFADMILLLGRKSVSS